MLVSMDSSVLLVDSSTDLSGISEAGKEGKKDFHAAKDEMLSLLAGILKKNQLNEKVDEEKSELWEEKMEQDESILEVAKVPKSNQVIKLKVRRDLVIFGASDLGGNVFSSKEDSTEKSPLPELMDKEEDGVSEIVVDGENPNNISENKRKFGNFLSAMLKNNPQVPKVKKQKNSFLSYFVQKAEPKEETVSPPAAPSAQNPDEPAEVVEVEESEVEDKEKENEENHNVKLPEPLDEKLINDLLDSPCKKKVSDEPELCEVMINEVEEIPTEETKVKEVDPEVKEIPTEETKVKEVDPEDKEIPTEETKVKEVDP